MTVKQIKPGVERWYHKITVEPCVFLEMLSFMLKMIVEQVFFLYRACVVNHGYSHDICMDIEHHQEVKEEVQITVSTFHMWNNLAMYGIPIVMSPFMGAWSDRRGRKLPLILGLAGKLISTVMIAVNAQMSSWPLEYVLFTSTLPGSLLGSDVAIIGSFIAYVTDITTSENRTIRITMYNTAYLMSMPAGVILGSVLFDNSVESFTVVFGTSAVILLSSIIYAVFRLKSQTTDRQTSILELPWYRMPADYFDCSHIVSSVKIFIKRRPLSGRLQLYALMLIEALFVLYYEESPKLFLYVQLMFNWDVHLFSYYKTYKLTASAMVLLAGVPLVTKLFKIRDTFIIMIGSALGIFGYLVIVFARLDWLMFVGVTLSVWCCMIQPMGFSMISRMIPSDERGVIFSLLSAFKIVVRVLGGALLTLVYNASINSYPQAFMWVIIGALMISMLAVICVHFSLHGRSIDRENLDECSRVCQTTQNGGGVQPKF